MSAGGSAFTGRAVLAPRFATTCPGASQSFRDQNISEAVAMAHENPEGAAITILVTTRPRLQFEWTLVHEFDQPFGRAATESKFRGAFGLTDLGCIDVCNPDFRAIDPQRIAIDDAGGSMAVGAFFKLYRSHVRRGQRHRWGTDRYGGGACKARDHREDREIALPSLFPEGKPEIMRMCQMSNAPVHDRRCVDLSRSPQEIAGRQ